MCVTKRKIICGNIFGIIKVFYTHFKFMWVRLKVWTIKMTVYFTSKADISKS
jgi:hypothetical protein